MKTQSHLTVIDLVHKRDVLIGELSAIDAQLGAITWTIKPTTAITATNATRMSSNPTVAKKTVKTKRGAKTARAVEFIATHPDATYPKLAQVVYGDTSNKALRRARTLVFQLRNKNIVAGDPGSWRVRNGQLVTASA